jgi:hypothetical protein
MPKLNGKPSFSKSRRCNKILNERDIADLDTFIRHWHELADGRHSTAPSIDAALTRTDTIASDAPRMSDVHAGLGSPATTAKSVRRRTVGNSKKEVVAEAAVDLILAKGAPMNCAELHPALLARGLRINGSDPIAVLYTMLWRMQDRVARPQPRGGFWIAGRPLEGEQAPPEHHDQDRVAAMAPDQPQAAIEEPDGWGEVREELLSKTKAYRRR